MRRIAVDDNDVVTHFESKNLLRLATLIPISGFLKVQRVLYHIKFEL